MRIGVFICQCGDNIASVVNIERLKRRVASLPSVVCVCEHSYLCSADGQRTIGEKIDGLNLERVVVAACSPSLHTELFRNAVAQRNLNPEFLVRADIREGVSWVHRDGSSATEKAFKIIEAKLLHISTNEPFRPLRVGLERQLLVVGGGIAGITTSLIVAEAGYRVILVEEKPSIGGHMAQLSETFPTLDCAECILTPKMSAVSTHPNIELLTYSRVEDIEGFVGNFKVRIRRHARSVDERRCIGCLECVRRCPVKTESEFDRGLSERKAIYLPFPQAIPNVPVIDRTVCRRFTTDGCGICAKVCPADAIDYDDKDRVVETRVGAIVVATGYSLYPKGRLKEYGGGRPKDIVDGLQYERILSSSGPTGGRIVRPSDGETPSVVAFIQCAGSRDTNHLPYCSRICCSYTIKQALITKKRLPSSSVFVFYIDIRAVGKNYEAFYKRAQSEGVTFIRGRASKIEEREGRLIVHTEATLLGRLMVLEADLVVVATGMKGCEEGETIGSSLRLPNDEGGFIKEAHPKLRPVESGIGGIYIVGCAVSPRDIQDTVSSASAAASKVISLFLKDHIERADPTAFVDADSCVGCGLCVSVCPYNACKLDESMKSVVEGLLCEGCGACATVCPSSAIKVINSTSAQLLNVVRSLAG